MRNSLTCLYREEFARDSRQKSPSKTEVVIISNWAVMGVTKKDSLGPRDEDNDTDCNV